MTFRIALRSRVTGTAVSALLVLAASGYPAFTQTMPEADAAVGPQAISAALAAARQAADAAWSQAPLAFSVATFTQQTAKGFGQYEPRGDNSFKAGESLHVYVEPVGYGYGRGGETYEIAFSADFELRNTSGQILAGQNAFADLALVSRNANKEYQASLSFRFDNLLPGDYVLRTRLNDRHSDKAGSFSLPFNIKADAAAQ